MTPQPPLLVIRENQSFWVEQMPVNEWSATLQAFREGCFRGVVCYDVTGGLWPIVSAVLKKRPSLAQRLLPWRRVQVEIHFGTRSQADLKDIVSRLAVVLGSESKFNEFLAASLTDILHRFEGAHSPSDVIHIAGEYMGAKAAQP